MGGRGVQSTRDERRTGGVGAAGLPVYPINGLGWGDAGGLFSALLHLWHCLRRGGGPARPPRFAAPGRGADRHEHGHLRRRPGAGSGGALGGYRLYLDIGRPARTASTGALELRLRYCRRRQGCLRPGTVEFGLTRRAIDRRPGRRRRDGPTRRLCVLSYPRIGPWACVPVLFTSAHGGPGGRDRAGADGSEHPRIYLGVAGQPPPSDVAGGDGGGGDFWFFLRDGPAGTGHHAAANRRRWPRHVACRPRHRWDDRRPGVDFHGRAAAPWVGLYRGYFHLWRLSDAGFG